MEFQQRLYELRKQSGLSQEGLADLLGVSRQAVQKWEAGTSRPDLDNLAALARYFNVSLDYLVTGQVASPSPSQPSTTIVNNYYTTFRYEYKSKRTLFGLPLIHIRLGDRGVGVASSPSATMPWESSPWAAFLWVCSVWGGCPWVCYFLSPVWPWAVWLSVAAPSVCWLSGAARLDYLPWAAVPSGCTPPEGEQSPRKSPSAAPPTPRWPSAVRFRGS